MLLITAFITTIISILTIMIIITVVITLNIIDNSNIDNVNDNKKKVSPVTFLCYYSYSFYDNLLLLLLYSINGIFLSILIFCLSVYLFTS